MIEENTSNQTLPSVVLVLAGFGFLWPVAHRLRVTLHGFRMRQDAKVAVVVYLWVAVGMVLTVLYPARI